MYPLLACSVFALAVGLERAVNLVRTSERSSEIWASTVDAILALPEVSSLGLGPERRRADGPAAGLASGRGPCATIAREILAELRLHRPLAVSEFERIVTREGRRSLRRLQERLGVLTAVSHLAPLMGLMGTVIGIIEVFQGIQGSSTGIQAAHLAGGIWVALLTTVFGMLIAIPAAAGYHLLDAAVDRVDHRLQSFVEDLEALMRELGLLGTGATAAEVDDAVL